MTKHYYLWFLSAFILLAALTPNSLNAQSASDGFKGDLNAPAYRVATDVSGNIYVAGQQFSTVNGVSKSHLARLNRDGALDTSYNPNPISGLQGLTAYPGGKLVVVGGFSSIGGAPSGGIARLNSDGTNDGSFTASVSGAGPLAVDAVGRVLVGGHFTDIGGQTRNRLARFNADGTLDAGFTPNVDSAVFGIALQSDGKILIAGQFSTVNGQARWRFARLNDDGTLDTSFAVNTGLPGANGTTYSIDVQADGKIIVGGSFSRFGDGNIVHSNLARVNPNGSIDHAFAPNFNLTTYSVRVQPDGKILVGGIFTTVNGADRQRIVRLDMSGTVDTTFVGSAADAVQDVELQQDGRVLMVGSFTSVNGFPSINRIASLYPDGRLNSDTNTTVAGAPPAVMLSLPNGRTLIGGGFTSVGGAPRQGLARIGWTGANDSSFANPQLTGWVYALGAQPDGNYIAGGDFTSAGGTSQAKLARITPAGAVDGSFAPTFDAAGWVSGVAIQGDGKILIGGGFTTVNGSTRTRLARLNATGSIDSSFNATADFYVDAIAIQSDGKILIGGAFENVNGQPRAGIARLNANGTLDTAFAPVLNGIVREILDIKIDKAGKILIGGAFTGVNGNPRTNVARLHADGSLDTAFGNANLDGAVHNIAETVLGPIYVSGGFDNVGGAPHAKIAMLNTNGTVNTQFVNTFANDKALAMTMRSDGKVLIGGYFTSVSGQSRGQLAAISFPQPAIYDLQVTSDRIRWYRWWYAPEITRVVFERSADGVNYVPLGNATRSSGNWDLNIPNANAAGYIRARGYYGDHSDRGSVTEEVKFVSPTVTKAVPFDFDGDRKSDVGIFRQPGEWWIQNSSSGGVTSAVFGIAGDIPVPADYTGDSKTDQAVWRPSTGEWFVQRSGTATYYSFTFGTTGDIPMPGDYDGDQKADVAVFRPSNATWYIGRSSDGQTSFIQFGANGDQPVPGDYDGDGKKDVAVFRPADGSWWILRSSDNQAASFAFGIGSDRTVPGDYTGDGKTDAAVWRPSTGEWFFLRSENQQYYSFTFGMSGDVAAPADFDGDGRYDVAVFRPTQGVWYISGSTAGNLIVGFGANGDRPIPNSFVR